MNFAEEVLELVKKHFDYHTEMTVDEWQNIVSSVELGEKKKK